MSIKNKRVTNLIILMFLIILIATILISLNNSIISNKSESLDVYNFNQSIWKFRHNGGLLFQTAASSLSYLGIAISSTFDKTIKEDMVSINWDLFNTSEEAVLDSKKVSFYKGVPVFRFNYNRSGSFLAIFLTRETNSRRNPEDVIRHEWGHNIQQLILGPINSFLCIFLPSWQQWSNRSYYNRPWEITADIFGGVTSRKHTNSDIARGYKYLDISAMFGILSYSFLPGEY